ncbi:MULTISPECIES: DUF3078 domain-containing protein [Flavobacterium]|uniref:DUF3078 domain-containing protein n=1 Tax=Flavobacterium columnare TaxID=996 RepID=A0AA94F0I2_9FLAO|nr:MULTISPECIES: DUF3078 domain-containing protein [Flavobacterium]OXA82880.1 hypothetical protein B0A56_04015 [Flavobacterium columnare NBRC 100251 = ATCC 23463]MCH4829682.1 DUF3078 domain-containing protein [Flavobacterium columnare]MCH4831321.1 DUF3078 domain-containing protein [Flavobacterium columnare]OWP87246.1 hypothetical protein BWK60_04595 [Flavobacterium covae]QYS91801.1 DUF3078 domain-containing protein [Flavobacterium covae]
MKNKTLFILFLFCFLKASSQEIITTLPDTVTHWKKQNKISLDINQISFINWNAGGNNSISGLIKGDFKRIFQHKNIKWHNELLFRYGINKQDGQEIRKTEDVFLFNSTLGFKKDSISNWHYSAKLNFNTQFANGYKHPNFEKPISSFFAPAYLFIGIGTEYIDKDQNFKIYLSPLTQKSTFVFNTDLANEGAFGVEKGKKYRNEIGVLLTAFHKDEIYQNIYLENKINLYTDYLNNFGNIDVNWQLQFDFIINKYVSANINANLLYDDDVKTKNEINGQLITSGAKIQFKQIIGIGLNYSF